MHKLTDEDIHQKVSNLRSHMNWEAFESWLKNELNELYCHIDTQDLRIIAAESVPVVINVEPDKVPPLQVNPEGVVSCSDTSPKPKRGNGGNRK